MNQFQSANIANPSLSKQRQTFLQNKLQLAINTLTQLTTTPTSSKWETSSRAIRQSENERRKLHEHNEGLGLKG
jgi:hypothetical protein